MVVVFSARAYVEIATHGHTHGFKEVAVHFGGRVPDILTRELHIPHEIGTASEIDEYHCLTFIHWQYETIAFYTAFGAEGHVNCVAEGYGYVLHRMVFVYLQVAVTFESEGDSGMVGELPQHVVKEFQSAVDC